MKASTDTAAFFATYGVTVGWDVGIALPVMRVDLEATAEAEIVRLGTAYQPLVHTFQTGADVSKRTFTDARSASGIGDIALRTKYNFYQRGAQGVAATFDLRLPTGDAENLLGTGAAQSRLGLVLSSGTDRFAQHANVGYTFSGKTDIEHLHRRRPGSRRGAVAERHAARRVPLQRRRRVRRDRSADAARRVHGADAAQRRTPRDGRAVVLVHAAGPAGAGAGARVPVVPRVPGAARAR